MTGRSLVLVGTPKGAFILESDADRRDWSIRGPLCDGWPVHDISVEPGTNALLAGAGSPWFGPAVWRSEDLGETWTHSSEGLTYGDDGPKVATVWNVTAGTDGIYAGVEPAGLFRSLDRGKTWEHVEGLTNHYSRPEWGPGAGGLILHTIIPHPTDGDRMWVGISAVGVFETQDGGATWSTRNKGVRAEFNPENRFPDFGQCVHKLVMAADGDERLYQQNHCGVYRSTDGGAQWEEITRDLPSDFGFVMTAHPRDPMTVVEHPAHRSRAGTPDAGRLRGGVADARRRRHVDPVGRRPAAGERVRRRAARGDGARRSRPGRRVLRDELGPGVRVGRRGPDVEPDRGQPAADLERRGARP